MKARQAAEWLLVSPADLDRQLIGPPALIIGSTQTADWAFISAAETQRNLIG